MDSSNKTSPYTGNKPFALMISGLLDCSPKTGEKTTLKTLAEYLGVKQQTVSLWRNGGSTPELKYLLPIAVFFGVSCDYLLGKSSAPTNDKDKAAVCEYLGLPITAVDNVLAIIDAENPLGGIYKLQRKVMNELLSHPRFCWIVHAMCRLISHDIDAKLTAKLDKIEKEKGKLFIRSGGDGRNGILYSLQQEFMNVSENITSTFAKDALDYYPQFLADRDKSIKITLEWVVKEIWERNGNGMLEFTMNDSKEIDKDVWKWTIEKLKELNDNGKYN